MTRRTALVTGGSRGIGRAIATTLAARGHAVALTYATREPDARGVVEAIRLAGGEAMTLQLVAEERASIRAAVAEIRRTLGPIGVLVNNAAIAQEKPFPEITDADWDRMFAVNLRGPFACAQEVLPDMLQQRWGRIVNISSIGGQWGGVLQVHYACAKAGLNNLTRSLAKLYSGQGVTTNTIAGGLVATEMIAKELATPAGREKVRNIPAGRIATPDEVASAVAFLASDEAAYVTGQTLNVNGGMYFGA
ncbi:MAG TPA: 3-oxoacyl-ACP reductase family protein [Vicinamibacterales bacterium]|nr:3-oxoacyl-ACP reductase family protein [Vicinamibacterales bacterium]